jgi:hypothetical protein
VVGRQLEMTIAAVRMPYRMESFWVNVPGLAWVVHYLGAGGVQVID